MHERRRQQRADIDEIGYISGDGSSLQCRVLNISASGAAIELPEKRFIESRFKLMLGSDRVIRECRLIWSSENRIGVEFVE
ncbi:PilZ domain-containing protein [Bradyrhizobium sp. CIAT3101]|uniref:PilZ domain-containing protein n=1 Tax=Bradyrhizobium sp. CIAT3101 TaxID=439387 RepID=UPI0024B04E0D|nr:PilZ domain-containing protein [Bradyrhizobium sp. CIAT3101]WFU79114.1 PilZ domain-containing protein [Bradyrhizobium sp. CIAT3101]